MLLLEPLLLQKTATTLGKWLLGLSVPERQRRKAAHIRGAGPDGAALWRAWAGDPDLLLGAPV